MRLFSTVLLIVLMFFVVNAARTPTNTNPCSKTCTFTKDSLFKPGNTYTYSYEGESKVRTLNGPYDTTGILIKSRVTITGLSNCEMKLSMYGTKVFDRTTKDGNEFQESPNSEKIRKLLEQNEVFFTRENEKVQSICMDKDEPVWSENIKKVIIDAIANNGIQTKNHENQMTSHGDCFIHNRTVQISSSSTTVKFDYDMKNCVNNKMRKSIFTDLTQASLFSQSSVNYQYLYENKKDLKKIQCTEYYQLTPFRQYSNAIVVEIQTKLTKESESYTYEKKFSSKNVVRTGIEQSMDELPADESTYSSVKRVLKEICDQQVTSTSSMIPKLFMQLINQLKELNSKEFKEIYLDVLSTDICTKQQSEIRSIFYDAVSFVNTPASTSVMVDLIKNNQLSLFDQNVWLASLSFMQQTPTIEMLKDLESLISIDKPTSPMYLGISAVTNLYCKANHESCQTDPTIKSIISKFLSNLNNDCSQPSKDDNKDHLLKMQISLKALGNLKVFTKQVTDVLDKCVSTKTNSQSIRISALEVMRFMDCQKDRSIAMNILENNENDSELRINAYLTVMGCSDINTLFKVRKILETEKANQVGSFIWTHLTNIKESRDPLKASIKELLENIELKKAFDVSKLKFSRNVEKTLKLDNFGVTFDSNIIFSEKSFVPRSISLNTTALILNRPTNFLEMSARLEGLEELLFKLFGPDGYMKKQSNVEDNLALINMLNEMNGNLNIKLYGQQISFIELVRGSLGSVKKYNIIEELLSWSRSKQFQMNKNLQIIDKTTIIPTMLGFPLQLKLQGSVAINIKIQSKIDIDGLFSWPMAFNIDNHISPNINAEFNADVALQAPFTKYGMRLNLKSGTNTELKAKIFANKNEEFSIKVDTPKTKQELISIEGSTYVIHRNEKIQQLTNKMKNDVLCSGETVTRILGVKLCLARRNVETDVRANTLFYEPFSTSVYIEKSDTQTGYIIQASSKSVAFVDSKTGHRYTNRFLKFELNTPNSHKYNRRFFGEFVMDFKEKHIKLEVLTPWNQVLMMTNFKLTDKEKKMRFNFQIDKKDIVDIMAEHVVFKTSKGKTIKCGITVSIAKFTPITTKWSLDTSDEQWLFNFNSKGLMKDDTQVKIKVTKVRSTRELSLFNKYQVSGFYNSYFGRGKISGIASENYYGHRWDVKLNHKPKDKTQNEFTFVFRHKTEDKSSKNLNKYILTTTFAYGKTGENVLKLRTESELSDKHVRGSLKVSSGQNTESLADIIDLQLYGGHRWKEDKRHYAEGSLSLKLPRKNINYEGRYNSEVGKRMFKLAIALDKDQQSKLNLKINYLEPKLYLKNTDCEVIFSIPNSHIDMKWNLVETDVNRYKYSLHTKYNNYQMQLDGVQTQISRLNHESSITVKMPNIDTLPKQVNINLKVNLVDLSQASIQGKVEIPNSNHDYSIDTKFSLMPQNLYRMSSSDTGSVFKYDLEVSSVQRTVKSKFIFTCNPEEFQTYFNLNFDKVQHSDNQIEFDLYASRKNPNYRQYDTNARFTLRYPDYSHSIGLKSEFKYSEMMAQIDISWKNNKRISINTMYEIDNSWTEKGLKSSLTILTPFSGYEKIHFGVHAVGQLRYRKLNLECKWGSDKKILFDIIIYPKSSNDFSLNWKLVTPYQGWNLVSFNLKYLRTSQSISTEALLKIGPKRQYQIKFEGANNSEGRNRDFTGNVLVECGFYPAFTMSFKHRDDTVHFNSQFDAKWMKTQSINIKSDISYTFEDSELVAKANVELLSTIEYIKQAKATWSIDNRNGQFSNDIEILHNLNNVLLSSVKGFYESEQGTFKMEFNGEATWMKMRSMKIASNLNYQDLFGFQHQFSLNRDSAVIYSHNFASQKKSIKLKFLIPSSDFKTIEAEFMEKDKGKVTEKELFIKMGERYLIRFDNTLTRKSTQDFNRLEVDFKSKIFSDFIRTKELNSQGSIVVHNRYIKFDMTTTGLMTFYQLFTEINWEKTNQKFHFSVKSKYPAIDQFLLYFENSLPENNKSLINKIDINLNDVYKLNSKITIENLQQIDVDFNLKHRNFYKYLKLKHSINLIQYNHIFDTNIFGKRFRLMNTVQHRGGVVVNTKLNADFRYLKSFELFFRQSKQFEIIVAYRPQRDSKGDHKFRINYSNLKGLYKLNIDASSFFQTEINLDVHQFRKVFFEIKTPSNKKPLVRFDFKYDSDQNSMKHHNELKININDNEFRLKNKIENVNWRYVLLESEMKCSYHRLSNYKIVFDYQLKPSRFMMNLKAMANNEFVKLSTNVGTSSNSKNDFKLETSFPILKELTFEMKQKYSNTQMSHQCKTMIQFYDSLFKFDNTIEWSGINYLKIDLSMSGRISNSSFLIHPKSLKFVHHFDKNTLKEDLELSLSKDIDIKSKLQIPIQTKSRSSFELETSFECVRKLVVDLDVNFSENEEKFVSLKIQKNLETIFFTETKYKNHNKLYHVYSYFELWNSYKTGFEIELNDLAFGTKTLKGRFYNPSMRESIVLNAGYDSSKNDLTIAVSGMIGERIYLKARISDNQYGFKVKYGKKMINIEMISNRNENNIQHFKLVSLIIYEINYELLLSGNLYKMAGKVDKNSFEIAFKPKRNLEFNFKILDKEVKVDLKRETRSIYENIFLIDGTSNVNGWKEFRFQLKSFFDPTRRQLNVNFDKETKTVVNLNVEHIISQSFNMKYTSIYNYLASGNLELNYGNFPTKAMLTFNGKDLKKEFIKAELKLSDKTLKGQLTSPFDWMKQVTVKGKLDIKDDEMKGNFFVSHNKLDKSIDGEFRLEMKEKLLNIELKTPFSYPFNEISFKREIKDKQYTVEISNKRDKMLDFKFTKQSQRKFEIDLDITLAKPMKDLTLSLSSKTDLEGDVYSVKLEAKSNLFEEVNLEMILKKGEVLIKFSNSSKEGQLQLKMTPYQSTGLQITTLLQYGDSKNIAELVYEIKTLNDVYVKYVAKSSTFFPSSSGFEAHYKHKLVYPNEFNLDAQCKFNDKIILYKSISWQRQAGNNFDLSWKTILSPYEKEYENRIQLIGKRGEIFNLIISATDILDEPINVRFVARLDNLEFALQSPFEMAKSLLFTIRTEQKPQLITQTITFDSNILGKYQMINEYQLLSSNNHQFISQINTPFTNRKVYLQVNLKNQQEQSMNVQLEWSGKTYSAYLGRHQQQIQIKFNTPFEHLKKFDFVMADKGQSYEMEAFYNDHHAKLVITKSKEMFDIKIESNTDYFKDIKISVQKIKRDQFRQSISVKLTKDEKDFLLDCDMDKEKNSLKYKSSNDLLFFLPKTFSGRYQYSLSPIDFQVELKSNDIVFFEMIINENQILFSSELKVFLTSISKLKINVTRSKFELIVLANDVFSVIVTRTSEHQIDATIMIKGNQYSMRTIYQNTFDKFITKLSIYKNTVDKLLEINNEIGKREIFIESSISHLSRSIWTFKLSDKDLKMRTISLEMRLFSLNGVTDLIWDTKPNLFNVKVSWNYLYADQQIAIGSIGYIWKSSKPFNYLLSINLHEMALQVQLMETDNGQVRFQILSPIKGFDIDLKWLLTYESGVYKLLCSMENSFTGEFNVKSSMRLRNDPEIKFILSSTIPIINFKFNMITSVVNEVTFNTELRIFDWEKIHLKGKLSTKDLTELIVALNTPFRMARNIQVEKTIRYTSILEQTFKMKIMYEGIIKVKYMGGHEVNWEKRILKFQSSFHNEDMKIVSFDVDHSGRHDNLDHSTIWQFKDKKFGVKINGGFKPLFEGKTEIITPFHQAGKLVLIGKQMQNGILIEAGKDKELSSFEYIKKKDVRLIKITPPEQYGQSLGIKYKTRRFKRSTDNELESEITYGTDKVFEVLSKIKMDKNKYSAILNLGLPKLSTKSVEFSINHQFNDKSHDFDHKITVKDSIEKVYRLFGNFVKENSRHIKIVLNSEHPEYGLYSLSLGHSLTDNSYDNHFSLKTADKTYWNHNGNIKFDFEKPSLTGVWNTQINSHRHKWTASHSGDWKSFLQSMSLEYNDKPYLSYKSKVISQGRSEIEMEIPSINGMQIKLIVDGPERKVQCSLKTNSYNVQAQIINKNGNLQMTCQNNFNQIAALSIEYGKQPYYIKGNYLKNSGSLELVLEKDKFTLKMDSTFLKLSQVTLEVTKNSFVADANYQNKPYKMIMKYNYSPDSVFVTMETSVKAISRLEVRVSSKACKLTFNEYFQELQYDVKRNHIQIIGNNNFMTLKTILFDLQLDLYKKALLTIELNSYATKFKMEYSNDKFILENENNYLKIRSAQFELARKIDKDLQYWTMVLLTNQKEAVRIQYEIKNRHYSLGLESYLGHHLVASYNVPVKEMIISLKRKEQFLNIINKIQESSTTNSKSITIETSVDTSSFYLQKLNHQFKGTITESGYQMEQTLKWDGKTVKFNGMVSKSKAQLYISTGNTIYSGTISTKSNNDLDLELIIPGHHINTKLRRDNNRYSCDIECNKKNILNIAIQQSPDIKNYFNHESVLYYRGRMVWNFNLNTDFKKYKIKMKSPIKFTVTIVNDWKDREKISMGFHVKYDEYQKPVEIGANVKFLSTKNLRSFQLQLENSYHMIDWKRSMNDIEGNQITIGLKNKETKDHWELAWKVMKTKNFELTWKTPKGTKEIKYNQIIENNIRTSMELDVFDSFKFNLKSDKNFPNLWSGSLSLFSNKIASIEVGKEHVKLIFNDNGPENKRLLLKWTISTKGQWKKDYIQVKQLILVQKSMNIDLNIVQKTRMETSVYSKEVKITYQLLDGTMRTMKYGASVDFSKPDSVTLELQNPILPMKTVINRLRPDPTSLRYEMETLFDGKDQISGFFLLKTDSNPGVTMRLNYNPQDRSEFVQIHSKYINDHEMEAHIFTEKNSKKTTYFQYLIRLLNEYNIETTFEWKTYMVTKLSKTVTNYRDQLFQRALKFFSDEIQFLKPFERYQQIQKLIPNYDTLFEKTSNVYTQFQAQVKSFFDEFRTMKERNEFFIKTIYDEVSRTVNLLNYYVRVIVELTIPIIESIQIQIIHVIQALIEFSFQVYKAVFPDIEKILMPIKCAVSRYSYRAYQLMTTDIIKLLENFRYFIESQLTNVMRATIQIKRVAKLLILNQTSKILGKTIQIVKLFVGKFREGSFDFLKHEKELKIIYNNFIDRLEKASENVARNVQSILNQADDRLSVFSSEKYFQSFGIDLKSLFQQIIKGLRDDRYQEIVKRWIYSLIDDSFTDLRMKIEENTINVIWPYVAVFDMCKGQRLYDDKDFKMVFKFTSPIPIHDLKSIPDFGYPIRKLTKIVKIIEMKMKMGFKKLTEGKNYMELKDWLLPTFPKLSLPQFLPEFESYATISKASVVTFDKRLFQLTSDSCRVLLSKDNRFKKWSIVLNQRKDGRSYTVNIGSNSIEISGSDYKISLNGKPAELPLRIGSTNLIGLGRVMKLYDENLGLTITVDPMNEMLTVGIIGWYHAKVRGLFGNNDNEPFNDLMLDDDKIVDSDTFMKKYNYNGNSCQIIQEKPNKPKQRKSCPFFRRLACKFNYKFPFSPMAACFKTVDPENFLQQCMDSTENLVKLDHQACESARQYKEQCSHAGIKIDVPLPCQKCDVPNEKSLPIYESRIKKIKEKVSDIVFIIDEGNCLRNLKSKLPNIVESLEREMHAKGISSVKFGLVTFVDEKENQATFHTVGQKMLGSSEEMIRSIQALKSSDGNFRDGAEAILLASKYPFREHASRHIVMLSCKTTTELPIKSYIIYEKLQQNAIHFSLLTDFSFRLKDNNMKSLIFGVDLKNIYSPLSRIGERNNTIRPVNDVLYKLTMKLKGVVFDYKFLINNQPLTQKSFINTFVSQISQSATPARSTKCTCVNDGEYSCVPLDVHTIFPVTKVA